MKYALPLLVIALLSTGRPPAATAGELTVSHAGVVAPDAELEDFIGELRRAIMSARVRDYAVFDSFFAPRIAVFQRSLDPLQPWNPGDPMTVAPLTHMAEILVEQEPVEGQPAPDYREDVLRAILRMIWGTGPRGTMKEVPGQICTPAEYDFDREAALAFARKFDLDAYSLRFFPKNVFLSIRPKGKRGTRVPANTLMMFDYDPKAPAGWGRYETAGGVKGYMEDRDDTLGLSQNHICFARVKGKYRITAVFGYGL